MELIKRVRELRPEERASYLNNILGEVRTIAANDPELGLPVKYTRTRDDARFELFAGYEGPDDKTLSFLTDLKDGNINFWTWAQHKYWTPAEDKSPLPLLIRNYMWAVEAHDDDG